MRLIDARTLKLTKDFYGTQIPEYAILSHAWEEGEVTYQDWQDPRGVPRTTGYLKIKGACRQALKDGIDYIWVCYIHLCFHNYIFGGRDLESCHRNLLRNFASQF